MRLIKRIKNFFHTSLYSNLHSNLDLEASYETDESQVQVVDRSKMTPINFSWPGKNQSLFKQLEDKYYQFFIGVNSLLQLDLNAFELEVVESLENTIEHNRSLAEEIPRLPDIIPKLIHLFRSNEFTWKEAAHLISQDPVLLVGIIKVANSSRYNLQVKDEALEHVLVQLGVLEVRKILMRVALKPILLVEGGHFLKHSGTKIWIHSVKSAEACHTLAKLYEYDPFDAYLAGLIHNLGMVIVVQKMNEIKEFKSVPRSMLFRDKLLKLSKLLSIKVAQNWDLNSNIILALKEQMQDDAKNIQSPLGKILYEANAVSMKHILVGERRWGDSELNDIGSGNNTFIIAYNGLLNKL